MDDCTGTPLFFYVNRLHQAKVVCLIPTPRGLHCQACIVVYHQATSPHGDAQVYFSFYINTPPTSTKLRRGEATSPTCLFPMKQSISCRAPTRQRQATMSDADEAGTTRPSTDKAKAAHLFELETTSSLDIDKAGGILLSIVGATDAPLHPSSPPHHHHPLHRALGEDKT